MRKYKYLTKPIKHPKKFIREMYSCVEKKYFMTLSKVIRNDKIINLIREFNTTEMEDITQRQLDTMDAIFQGCILIDDYNDLFFKDVKVKFINPDDFRTMQLKLPRAKLYLRFDKKNNGR